MKTKKWGKIVYHLALPVKIRYGLQKLELEVFGSMVAKQNKKCHGKEFRRKSEGLKA